MLTYSSQSKQSGVSFSNLQPSPNTTIIHQTHTDMKSVNTVTHIRPFNAIKPTEIKQNQAWKQPNSCVYPSFPWCHSKELNPDHSYSRCWKSSRRHLAKSRRHKPTRVPRVRWVVRMCLLRSVNLLKAAQPVTHLHWQWHYAPPLTVTVTQCPLPGPTGRVVWHQGDLQSALVSPVSLTNCVPIGFAQKEIQWNLANLAPPQIVLISIALFRSQTITNTLLL